MHVLRATVVTFAYNVKKIINNFVAKGLIKELINHAYNIKVKTHEIAMLTLYSID